MILWRPAVRWLLAIVIFVVAFAFSYGPGSLRMSFPAALGVSVLAAAAVWLSGVKPAFGLGVGVGATLLLPVTRSTFDAMDLVLVLIGFQATLQSHIRVPTLVVVIFGTLTVNDVWLRYVYDRAYMDPSVLYPALLTALSVGLGAQSRDLLRRQVELVSLHDADRYRAVSDERRRIARDLHDIAAHHLSSLVVRNRLARRLTTFEALDEAAEFTADTAADALDALRNAVHVLATESDAPMSPQPCLADLDDVVGRVRGAGLDVEWRAREISDAPRDVQVAIVRIAQEALSNVLRHRGPGRAWLRLEQRQDRVHLIVDDDGPSSWHPALTDATWRGAGTHGLLGMRERAAACGGELRVERSAQGGWRVCADLPLGSA